jgi:hypothetical protein
MLEDLGTLSRKIGIAALENDEIPVSRQRLTREGGILLLLLISFCGWANWLCGRFWRWLCGLVRFVSLRITLNRGSLCGALGIHERKDGLAVFGLWLFLACFIDLVEP